LLLFLFAEKFLYLFAQPVFRNLGLQIIQQQFLALKVMAEYLVEAVVMLFVLDQGGARQIIKGVQAAKGHLLFQRLQQGQEFLERYRQASVAQGGKEIDQHGQSTESDKEISRCYSGFRVVALNDRLPDGTTRG